MWWFTADEHYGHKGILKYNDRGTDDIDAMDKDLIGRFNSVVVPGDVTVHAGDFCWCNKRVDVERRYIRKLNGTHILLVGSHDHWQRDSAKYVWRKRIDGQVIMVCHYAMRVWESSHYGAWMLYGHSHGRLEPLGLQHDVGVDNNGLMPVSLEQVKDIMDNKHIERVE